MKYQRAGKIVGFGDAFSGMRMAAIIILLAHKNSVQLIQPLIKITPV